MMKHSLGRTTVARLIASDLLGTGVAGNRRDGRGQGTLAPFSRTRGLRSRLRRRAAALLSIGTTSAITVVAISGSRAFAGPQWKPAPVSVEPDTDSGLGIPLESDLPGPLGDLMELALLVINHYYGYVALIPVILFLVFHPRLRSDRVMEDEEQPLRPT